MTKKKYHLLVDMDGVIADWNGLFARKIVEHFPHIDFPFLKDNHSWDMAHGLDAEGIKAIDFVKDLPGFYAEIEAFPGAAEALNEMLDDGHTVNICTSPTTTNITCASDKLVWLERDIGKGWADRAIITPDKTVVRGDFLYDDKNKITGLRLPEWKQVIVDAPYNLLENDGRQRIADITRWQEAIQ